MTYSERQTREWVQSVHPASFVPCPRCMNNGHSPCPECRQVIGGRDIPTWNDAPGRTKEEVLAAFDEAIRRTAPEPQDPLANVSLDFSPEAVAMP